MSNPSLGTEVEALKDESEQQPIPTAWRPVFCEMVSAFVKHDYRLESGVPGVEPVSVDTAVRIQNYIKKYGATLVPLPEETWNSSIAMWYGDFWDVLIDLWTQEEGPSDLVLSARVREDKLGFAFQIRLVYVP
jgi:hypothetical protein